MHARGCPVEISYPNPTPATPAPIGVVKRAPRPYAAALLLDYILSEPAQKIFSESGRSPAGAMFNRATPSSMSKARA